MLRQVKSDKPCTREKGLTLLEVVVSIGLLSIILLSFTNLFNSSHAASVQAGKTTQAAALAQEKMETLLGCSYEELIEKEAELNGIPVVPEGFEDFTCYHNITHDTLELNGYQVNGLRLEVGIVQGEGKQLVKFTAFVHKEHW
ncbi:MAG: type II secretion system protein [Firmicutes bacterium]|nr:type II secretion system protein [Bacillota bacterium]